MRFPCAPAPAGVRPAPEPSDSTGSPAPPETVAGSLVGHVFLESAAEDAECLGYARVDLTAMTSELTVLPDRDGAAVELAGAVRHRFGVKDFWAKGRGSAAAALPGETIRHLDIMTRGLSPLVAPPAPPAGVRIRPFDPDHDPDPWLRLNRAAFAGLPDQAGMTRDDLDGLLGADWFDPAGFLVAEPDPGVTGAAAGSLLGYHWTKVSPDERLNGQISGEVFALGVAPDRAGSGLAAALLDAGLTRMARRGVRQSHLYVESSNIRAHAFYLRHGYQDADSDRLLRVSL